MFACLVCFCNRDYTIVHSCTRSKDHLRRQILAYRGSSHHTRSLRALRSSSQGSGQMRSRVCASWGPKVPQKRRRGVHIRSGWRSPQRALGLACLDWNSWSCCRTMAGLRISKCMGTSRSWYQREHAAPVSTEAGWRRFCLDAGWIMVFSYSNWTRGSCPPNIAQTGSKSSTYKAKACLRSRRASRKWSRGPGHISHGGWILDQCRGLHTPTRWSSWSTCRWTNRSDQSTSCRITRKIEAGWKCEGKTA